MNFLFVELPSLHLVWRRSGLEDRVCNVIRTNYPKPSALLVCAIAREVPGVNVKAVDMKIHNQDCIILYREFGYEDGIMIASRMGSTFESVISQLEWADVLALTINPASWANIASDFIAFAKQINPNLKIMVGGSDAMFRAETYLRFGADFIIRGEGEYVGKKLLERLMSGSNKFNDIVGLAYYDNGRLVDTGISRGCNLDDTPLQALDIFKDDIPLWNNNIEAYVPTNIRKPLAFLFMTQGCNQACDFCTTPQKYGRLRFRSLARIRKELELFISYGIHTLNIWDDSLSSLLRLGERDHLIAISNMIHEMGFAYEFSQGMVIKDLWDVEHNCPDYEIIARLYGHTIRDGQWVGCYGEYFPTEFLQEVNTSTIERKLMTYDKELEVMRAILEQGVQELSYSCIVGRATDGDTQFDLAAQRLNEMTEIVESYGAKGLATPFMFSILPGTILGRKELTNCQYPIADFPELYQFNAAPHGTQHYSPKELMAAKDKLESRVLNFGQCQKWWQTGRYQWK